MRTSTKHVYEHELDVYPDGTGLYKAKSRFSDSSSAILGDDKGLQRGDKIMIIPRDQEQVIVAGPIRDKTAIGICEVIFYKPGPSPQRGE